MIKASDVLRRAKEEFRKWRKNLPLGILSPSEHDDFERTYVAGFSCAIALAEAEEEK
jgi:hypothetical protein